MGASFRNTGEIEALAGCDKLTISPALLEELSQSSGELNNNITGENSIDSPVSISEAEFLWEMNNCPMSCQKLSEGIRQFYADQLVLEQKLTELFKS